MDIIFCPNCKEEIFFHNEGCEYCGWINFGVSLNELEKKQVNEKGSGKEKAAPMQLKENRGKVRSQKAEI
tara:strand:+ start:74 stop:283 length:210 start_codon:yes stop_codon:yes gene_type:complete